MLQTIAHTPTEESNTGSIAAPGGGDQIALGRVGPANRHVVPALDLNFAVVARPTRPSLVGAEEVAGDAVIRAAVDSDQAAAETADVEAPDGRPVGARTELEACADVAAVADDDLIGRPVGNRRGAHRAVARLRRAIDVDRRRQGRQRGAESDLVRSGAGDGEGDGVELRRRVGARQRFAQGAGAAVGGGRHIEAARCHERGG